jgi:hypothetical protein
MDNRREVGVIVADSKTVAGLLKTFEADWRSMKLPAPMRIPAKKLKKSLKAAMEPLSPILAEVVEEAVASRKGEPWITTK